MSEKAIMGIFLVAMLGYPVYFWLQFRKRNKERAERLREQMEQEAAQDAAPGTAGTSETETDGKER